MLFGTYVCVRSGQNTKQYFRRFTNKYLIRNIVIMAASSHKDFIKNLECPVCLDVCTDPRLLPCIRGHHTLCKRCLDSLVTGPTITCPECRANHTIPPSGTNGFSRNLRVAGMIDALCKECRRAHPEVNCPHCEKMLCRSCHVGHQAFGAVKTSIDKLHAVIRKGGKDVNKNEIMKLGVAIELEIDDVMGKLFNQLRKRKKALKVDLRQMIKTYLRSLIPWRKDVCSKILAAWEYIDAANKELGDEYSDQITNQQMTNITTQSQHKINEIESIISKVPPIPHPVLKFNSHQAASAISSFGSIELLHTDTEDFPLAVDSGPLTPSRPTVLGQQGSGPSKIFIDNKYSKTDIIRKVKFLIGKIYVYFCCLCISVDCWLPASMP